jgi:UDP-2,4-diacetamido-2,4,6-trideoxy-beta-L-altropyranose hydrolase
MNILFRADASLEIGLGHVMRCITLAQALFERGHQITFASKPFITEGHPLHAFQDRWSLIWLSMEKEKGGQASAQSLINQLDGVKFDWCIIDHYGIDSAWEGTVRRFIRHVMVIDDWDRRRHDADIFLNQNASITEIHAVVPASCILLLGTKFALLRPEFSEPVQRVHPEFASHILVNFGGSDPTQETLKVLRALADFSKRQKLQVNVVAGMANITWEAIVMFCTSYGWRAQRHTEDMAQYMREADIAIGAVGGTTWERCALGLPTIGIAVADNQYLAAEYCAQAGILQYLGPSAQVTARDIEQTVAAFCTDREARARMSQKAACLVDGKGTERVVAAIEEVNFA